MGPAITDKLAPHQSRCSLAGRVERLALCLAVVHTLLFQYSFAYFNPDKVIQVAAARSLLDGNGLTVPAVDPALPMQVYREPLLSFPPGYSLAVLPLLWATGNPWWATVLVDSCFSLLFFVAWKVVLDRVAEEPEFLRSAVWVYWVFAVPILTVSSSDVQALALFSASLAAGLWGVDHGLSWTVLSMVLLLAAAAVRYAYWPLVLVLPASLMMARPLGAARLKRALISLILGLGGLGALGVFEFHTAGHVTYLGARDIAAGVQWRELLRWYPFPAAALGIDLPVVAASAKLGLGRSWLTLLWIPSLFVLIGYFSWLWSSARSGSPTGAVRVFRMWGGMTGLITIVMLGFLTARYPKSPAHWTLDGWWTYVDEARYFAPFLPFLLVGFAAYVLRSQGRQQPLVARGVLILAVASYVIALTWNCWTWYSIERKRPASGWQDARSRNDRTALTAILREQLASGGVPLYVDADRERRSVARMAGLPTLESMPCAANLPLGVRVILAMPREPESARRDACRIGRCERVLELREVSIARMNLHDACGETP